MPETMPLFPLGTVLLPGASLPLHIFEPRYRQLTVDLVTGVVPDKQFGVVALREGWGPDDGRRGLHDVGCSAALQEVRRLPDGRFDIHTRGERRFRLLDVDATIAPYLLGTIEWLPDVEGEDDLAPLALAARAAHRRYCTTAWRARGDRTARRDAAVDQGPAAEGSLDEDDTPTGVGGEDLQDARSSRDPEQPEADEADEAGPRTAPGAEVTTTELAHVLAADCLLPLDDRQQLLAETCAAQRLRLVRALMVREAGLLGELHAVWAPTARFAVPHSPN